MTNWCSHAHCGKRIPIRVETCPHCGARQPKGYEDPNQEFKDLVYKQATEGLTDEEQKQLDKLRDKLRPK